MPTDDFAARRISSERIVLSEEESAAVEGWRRANLLTSRSEAMRVLIRLGLLSEIGRGYVQAMARMRDEDDNEVRS